MGHSFFPIIYFLLFNFSYFYNTFKNIARSVKCLSFDVFGTWALDTQALWGFFMCARLPFNFSLLFYFGSSTTRAIHKK